MVAIGGNPILTPDQNTTLALFDNATTAAEARMAIAVGEVFDEIDVRKFATGGDGLTKATRYTGWFEAWREAAGDYSRSYFCGHFDLPEGISYDDATNVELLGVGPIGGIFHWSGPTGGTMIQFIDTAVTGTYGHKLENFTLNGNTTALIGIRGQSWHEGVAKRLSFYDITTHVDAAPGSNSSCLRLEGCGKMIAQYIDSHQDEYTSLATLPDFPVVVTNRLGFQSSENTLSHISVVGAKKHGVWIDVAIYGEVTACSATNAGTAGAGWHGIHVGASCYGIPFTTLSAEGNNNEGIYIESLDCTYTSASCLNSDFVLNGQRNTIVAGRAETFKIGADAKNNIVPNMYSVNAPTDASDLSNLVHVVHTGINVYSNVPSWFAAGIRRQTIFSSASGTSSPMRVGAIHRFLGTTATWTTPTTNVIGGDFKVINNGSGTLTLDAGADYFIVSGSASHTTTVPSNEVHTYDHENDYWWRTAKV